MPVLECQVKYVKKEGLRIKAGKCVKEGGLMFNQRCICTDVQTSPFSIRSNETVSDLNK